MEDTRVFGPWDLLALEFERIHKDLLCEFESSEAFEQAHARLCVLFKIMLEKDPEGMREDLTQLMEAVGI